MTEISGRNRVAYGQVPQGWKLEKLKFFADIRNSNVDKTISEHEKPVRLCNYTDIYYNDQITSNMNFMEGSATEAEIERFQLRRNQVIITKDSEDWDDIGIPALVAENMPDVLCGYHLSVFEAGSQLDGGFLAWLCRSESLNDQFKLAANGVTRFGLSQYAMKNAFIVLPPLDTQRRIAEYLDGKTVLIDRLIEKKRELLDLLAEKRQTLITQIVTKGFHDSYESDSERSDLNRSRDYRVAERADDMTEVSDKNREVYGKVPLGWKLEKLKFFADVRNSNVDKTISEHEKPVRLCNYTDIYYNDQITSNMNFMEGSATEAEIERFQLRRNQVIITKDSEDWDDIGIPALVAENMPDVLCGYHLSVFEAGSQLDGGFLAWLCRSESLNDQFKLAANGVTRFGLSQYAMKNALIAFPPIETQSRISEFLDEMTAQIDQLQEKIRNSVALLEEYKSVQITAVVTGQVSVP